MASMRGSKQTGGDDIERRVFWFGAARGGGPPYSPRWGTDSGRREARRRQTWVDQDICRFMMASEMHCTRDRREHIAEHWRPTTKRRGLLLRAVKAGGLQCHPPMWMIYIF
jgi:hypothetical protein